MGKYMNLIYIDKIDFEEDENNKIFRIRGVAFRSGKIPSKGVYIYDDELDSIAKSLKYVPLIDAHSKNIKDILGQVNDSYVDNKFVRYSAIVEDTKAKDLIKRKIVNKVSIGLKYEFEYSEIIDNEEYLVLKGLSARELSLTLNPALEETSVEYSLNFLKEEDIEQTEVENENFDINQLMITLLQDRGKIVLDEDEYQEMKRKLKEMEELEKKHYWLLHTDPSMKWEERYLKFSIEQIQEIIDLAKSLARIDPQGSVAGDNTPPSKDLELKEDVREMIFRRRRDGKALKGNIHSIKDLKI